MLEFQGRAGFPLVARPRSACIYGQIKWQRAKQKMVGLGSLANVLHQQIL
jgi:hypothetical protein